MKTKAQKELSYGLTIFSLVGMFAGLISMIILDAGALSAYFVGTLLGVSIATSFIAGLLRTIPMGDKVESTKSNLIDNSVDFATWLQDNYSINKVQGGTDPHPKGTMRKDFTNESYTIEEIYRVYCNKFG